MPKDLNMRLITTLFPTAILFISSIEAEKQNLDICQTITGQAKGQPCHFPFSYDGAMKTKCTNLDSSFYWCSTAPEYHTNNYGECSPNCPLENDALNEEETTALVTLDTDPGCNDKWQKCISFSIPEFGCHDPEVQEGCRRSCNLCDKVTTVKRVTCSTVPNYDSQECKTISGIGANQNLPCVFPFTYEEQTYCECTKRDDTRYWCATATPFSWSEYGYCNDYCPVEGGRKVINSVPGYKTLFYNSNQTCGGHFGISMKRDTTLESCANLCDVDSKCWYFHYDEANDCSLYQSCIEERNDTSLGSTYLKQGCETVSGKDPNAPCVFPFQYEAKWHYACTDLGSRYDDEYWCATNEDKWYLEDDYYGDCSSKCPIDSKCKANEAYSMKNLSCVFPFTYKGVVHYKCTKDGLSKHWCPTKLSLKDQRYEKQLEEYIESGTYGHCNPDCPMEESGLNLTKNAHDEADCSCTDFVDSGGRGKCQTICFESNLLCCYVSQSTNCKEVRTSNYHFGETSEEPCHAENEEYRKYKAIQSAYCFPHTSVHPNILEAITECKKRSSCGMFFQQRIESLKYLLSNEQTFFLCSEGAQVNLGASQLTTLYVLEEDASDVARQNTLMLDISLKSSEEDNIATKMRGHYVSFFTFVALVMILMFRAVIRAIRKLTTYIKSFRSIFNLLCILFAGYMTMIESLRYFENKDASSFGYKQFGETPQDQYPTFSICLKSEGSDLYLYFDTMLSNLTGRMRTTHSDYHDILRGAIFYDDGVSKALQQISFKTISDNDLEKISFQLKDFVHEIRFEDRNSHPTEYYFEDEEVLSLNSTLPFHIGYQDPHSICFTRDADLGTENERRLDRISFLLEKLKATNLYILVFIHHPGQLTRSLDKPILQSKASQLQENRNVVFSINQVSVLRRRPDAIKKCDEGIHDDDRLFRDKVTRSAGCIPTYWMNFKRKGDLLNECTRASQMAQIYRLLENKKLVFDSYKPPCYYMTVVTGVLKNSMEWGLYLVLEVVYMDDFYQEIINVRDFGFESFWSGIGGFVGIFLGYSLLQTPDLVQSMWASTSHTRLKIERMVTSRW